jgi:hypothetical protein
LVVVIAVPCFGPAPNAADSPRFGRESALQVSSAFNTTIQALLVQEQVDVEGV